MMLRIQRLILDFVEDTNLTERAEIVHGSLYVKLKDPKGFDDFHKTLRTFFKKEIDNTGGVNMYAVGDEFAFDFVPEDRETPVFVEPYSEDQFSGKEEMDPTELDMSEEEAKEIIGGDLGLWGTSYPDPEYGTYSEASAEGLTDFGLDCVDLTDQEQAELDVLMDLQNDAKEGR